MSMCLSNGVIHQIYLHLVAKTVADFFGLQEGRLAIKTEDISKISLFISSVVYCTATMTNVSLTLIARLLLRIEYLCLVGLILFTDGYIDVRLTNPKSSLSTPYAGRLEVAYNGVWGTVCDYGFTDAAASVVCNRLGFGRTGSFIQNAFGSGSGRIWLYNVSCTGSESYIDHCRYTWVPLNTHDCDHSMDVSISCGYNTPVRLVNPSSLQSSPHEGRLEVWHDGSWGTVCGDGFTDAAAKVVCHSLGFGRAGSFVQNQYGTGSGQRWLNDVSCYGNETDINRCRYRAWGFHDCRHSHDVSIECDIDECSTGQSLCDSASTNCVNTIGSYRCVCKKGFRYSTFSSCTDIDECYTVCYSASSTCVNSFGSYRCSCKNGYENISWNSRYYSCRDINECNNVQSQCDAATTNCVNTYGSYNCSCREGYMSTASRWTSCTDINECTNGQSQCDAATTTCNNTAGSYNCSCKIGFEYSTFSSCTDINECISSESKCDSMSTDCIDTIGNYTCSCKDGFTYLNETTCMAVEELPLGGFGIGAIVGSSVGAFLILAAIVIVVLVFYWKRRKEVNQPSQRQCSQVNNGSGDENNCGNASVENNCGNPIIYMELDQTALGMGRKTTNNTQIETSSRLPVTTVKPKETAQSPVYGNVQSSIYATVVSSVDDKAQSPIYGNVQY